MVCINYDNPPRLSFKKVHFSFSSLILEKHKVKKNMNVWLESSIDEIERLWEDIDMVDFSKQANHMNVKV